MSYQLDHRQLADEMGIFFFDEQIGAGLPVWLPNGVAIRDSLEAFIKAREHRLGYQRVVSPQVSKGSLFECSGHLRSFGKNMFPPMKWPDENVDYYLRPMNCPHHHKVFSSAPRSYRDLPLRVAEYGQVYRYENSGSLRGLIRVRGLCQNDAHIYVAPRNSKDEIKQVLELHESCYAALGLRGHRYRLSKHDPSRLGDYDGSLEDWIKSEGILREALDEMKIPYFESAGEAAFYGPKIDVQMRVGPNEEESVASIQLDFNSSEKFDLKFIGRSGEYCRPWIIHRAPLGSHERFVALLLEYYDGQLPGWLSPIQLYILPVGEIVAERSEAIADSLRSKGLRVSVDRNQGSLSKRILFAHKLRPFAKLIIGQKELESGLVEVQFRAQKQKCLIGELEGLLQPEVAIP